MPTKVVIKRLAPRVMIKGGVQGCKERWTPTDVRKGGHPGF